MSRRRRWLRLAAAALAGGAVLGAAPPTAAVPAGLPAGVPAGVPAAVPGSRAAPADTDLPVTVTVTGLEPRDIRPDSAVIVAAVLRNTGREATGPLRIRLQRGTRMTTRGELARADTDPPPTGALTTPGVPVGEGLPAGGSRTVRYESSAAALALGGLGVYPLALSVVDASGTEVGRTETLLPYFPPDIDPVRTRVALFWPLLDRPHRLTGPHASTASAGQLPVFDDDLLARAVSPAGRLDRLLTLAEKVTGSVRLTIAVDPETIDELQTMVSGYRVAASGGRLSTPGRGGPAAAVWLARLKKIAPDHLLMVVPYGDPDVVAMERGGLGWLAQLEAPDADAVGRVLGVRPTTDLAWPPDGQLTDTTLDDVVRQGTDAVVLDPTALPGGRSPEEGATQSGVSPLPALEGQAVALVPDAALQRLVAAGADRRNPYAGGARLAEQRLLAELAMITAERPSDVRTLVIAPPRRWDPSPAYAAAVLRDLATLRWLDSTTALEAAQSTRTVDRGSLVYPPGAQRREISSAQVSQIGAVSQLVSDFRTALSNPDANAELSPYGDGLRRAGSSAWRGNQQAGRVYAARLRRQIGALRGKVTMTSPSSGVYTLTSSDSPLLITVQNDLDVPVKVRVRMDMPPGFEIKDVGDVEIQPGQKRSLRLTASVQRTGTFTVRGQLTTPGRGPLGQEITLSVRSTAYGGLALGVTGLAFAFLVGAVVVRLIRRLRAGDAGAPTGAGSPADRSLS